MTAGESKGLSCNLSLHAYRSHPSNRQTHSYEVSFIETATRQGAPADGRTCAATSSARKLSGREAVKPFAMKNISLLIERSKQAVRYWWLMLLIGIALLVLGILVFVYPAQSYVSMAVIFGWAMLAAGILETVISTANDHFVTGRGWMLASGIIQIILGLILIFNVALSAAMLPIVLGFWLLLRAFATIGLGGDMRALEVSGSGWTIVSGVLLLICALWMLFQPLVFGTTVVIVWVGIALLLAGIAAITLSLQLHAAHRCAVKHEC